MDVPTTPLHTEFGTLCLSLDTPQLPGDRLSALLDAIDQVADGDVQLVSYRPGPVRLEFVGSWATLDALRPAFEREKLRSVFGTHRPTTHLLRGAPTPVPRRTRRLVLLADSDPARARNYAEILDRGDIDTCVVSRGAAAQRLMQRTRLPFDAMIVHHRLTDFEAHEVLRRMGPGRRRCAVTVIDERVTAALSDKYYSVHAFRYRGMPDDPRQIVSWANATITETMAWRVVDQPGRGAVEEPPRLVLDPDQAADRLRFICGLSSLEREVAKMVLLGLRDLDIAKRLGKSERTAKRYVGRVLEKAGIQNRASLWAVLHRDGRNELRIPGHTPAGTPSSAPAGTSGGGSVPPGRPYDGPSLQVGW